MGEVDSKEVRRTDELIASLRMPSKTLELVPRPISKEGGFKSANVGVAILTAKANNEPVMRNLKFVLVSDRDGLNWVLIANNFTAFAFESID